MNKQLIAIHQFVPYLGYGDAMSNHTINLMELFRSWGYHSETYVTLSDPRVARHCKHYSLYKHQTKNLLIYHYGTACIEMTQFLLNWPEQLGLIYHNITPHHFYEFEDNRTYENLKQARADLKSLNVAPWAIGDSEYNCRELRLLGFRNVRMIPYFLTLNNLDKHTNTSTHQQVLNWLDDGYVNILFVGRIVPNKRQDELIRLLAYYQSLITPRARLLLIGTASLKYKTVLEIMAQKLGVDRDVHFLGQVKLKEGFTAYYQGASVFVSMSEHEGFGVPLLESMYFNVPVIAYSAAAVPETMGNAGILVTEKRYDVIGELINLLVTDQTFRAKIICKQRERLNQFDRTQLEELIRNWVIDVQQNFEP